MNFGNISDIISALSDVVMAIAAAYAAWKASDWFKNKIDDIGLDYIQKALQAESKLLLITQRLCGELTQSFNKSSLDGFNNDYSFIKKHHVETNNMHHSLLEFDAYIIDIARWNISFIDNTVKNDFESVMLQYLEIHKNLLWCVDIDVNDQDALNTAFFEKDGLRNKINDLHSLRRKIKKPIGEMFRNNRRGNLI